MSDLTVILDRKKLVVRMEANTVRIDRPGSQPERIPLKLIERVIVTGGPMVSCGVWRALTRENIPVVLLPNRGKGIPTYIGPGLSSSLKIRKSQYRASNNKNCVIKISRLLLSKKLQGQESLLKILGKGKTETELSSKRIRKFRNRMNVAVDIMSLMGYEGAAASEYFRSLSTIIPQKWNFSSRNRRPPKDPVNALLSLSYTLAGSEVLKTIQQKGLDPVLGFIHSPHEHRENLMFDILEPIRPTIDEFALKLIFELFSLRDFTTNEQDGCMLNKKGRKIYYYEWAKWLNSGSCNNNLKEISNGIIDELLGMFS